MIVNFVEVVNIYKNRISMIEYFRIGGKCFYYLIIFVVLLGILKGLLVFVEEVF